MSYVKSMQFVAHLVLTMQDVFVWQIVPQLNKTSALQTEEVSPMFVCSNWKFVKLKQIIHTTITEVAEVIKSCLLFSVFHDVHSVHVFYIVTFLRIVSTWFCMYSRKALRSIIAYLHACIQTNVSLAKLGFLLLYVCCDTGLVWRRV
jgi:hypothetical protein